jgi:hypothetical protein
MAMSRINSSVGPRSFFTNLSHPSSYARTQVDKRTAAAATERDTSLLACRTKDRGQKWSHAVAAAA